MVARSDPTAPWKIIGEEHTSHTEMDVDVAIEVVSANTGSKRPRSPSTSDLNAPDTKRLRAAPEPESSSVPCLAPTLSSTAEKIYTLRGAGDMSLGAGDIFLTEGWRERWCHCASVRLDVPIFASFPVDSFLLKISVTLRWSRSLSF